MESIKKNKKKLICRRNTIEIKGIKKSRTKYLIIKENLVSKKKEIILILVPSHCGTEISDAAANLNSL